MIAQQPACMIFDLGNVLVHIHPAAFLKTLGIDSPENRRIFQRPITDAVKTYERGDETTEQFLRSLGELFKTHPATRRDDGGEVFPSADLRKAMLAIIGRPVDGMEELVRSVSTKVPLGLLSNTNPIHFDSCLEHLAVLRFIPSHFLSYRLRSLKPEQAIFQKTIELTQLDPRDILYVDDIPENVEAARKAGLNAHLFVGAGELRELVGTLSLL